MLIIQYSSIGIFFQRSLIYDIDPNLYLPINACCWSWNTIKFCLSIIKTLLLTIYPTIQGLIHHTLKKNIRRHHNNMTLIEIRSVTRNEKVFCYVHQIVDLKSPTTSTYVQYIWYMCVCVWSVNKSYLCLTLGLYKRFIYIDGLSKDRWTGPNWCVHTTHIYHFFFIY